MLLVRGHNWTTGNAVCRVYHCRICHADTWRRRSGFQPRPGYLYGLVHPDRPGQVKVGRTLNVKRRLRDHNGYCPRKLYRMAFALYVPCHADAEAAAHRLLGAHRLGTSEWFSLEPAHALALLASLPQLEHSRNATTDE